MKIECPECKSEMVIDYGLQSANGVDFDTYKCNECGRFWQVDIKDKKDVSIRPSLG